MFDDLKKKIKETGIESKKYLVDPNHPYHRATGFLKVQIVCGYIGIALAILCCFVLIYYLSKYNLLNTMRLLGSYLGVASTILYSVIVIEFGLYIVSFVLCVIMFKKLKNKETDFLLYYHNLCIITYVILFISLFFDFRDSFFRIIWFTILFVALTYYYCT